MHVSPKKHLGQHFLTDENIALKIAQTIQNQNFKNILEIGPGTGVLTKHLITCYPDKDLKVLEIDKESVEFLNVNYPSLKVISGDFLKIDNQTIFSDDFMVIGNFPYNISSQIVFKVIENRHHIPVMAGMFQKEVAERICEKPNTKAYGIISVLTQAYFDCTYLFTVSEHVFNPPPKVKSGVLIMVKKNEEPDCDMVKFTYLVKKSFNQRRKMLRKSLKSDFKPEFLQDDFFMQRPENLSVEDFVYLTKLSVQ
jgi:16S rRNA (adenine1518-N6/adenine1519-N6)-dimethyltransferase